MSRALTLLSCLLAPTAFAAAPTQPARDVHGDPLPPGAFARLGTGRMRFASTYPRCAAFSPDGRRLATADTAFVCLWDRASGKLLLRLPFIDATQLAFAPDGKTLAATATVHTVSVWNAATGQALPPVLLEAPPRSGGRLSWASFSPDTRLLAAVSGVYDLTTGKRRYPLPRAAEQQPVFSADGKRLAFNDGVSVHVLDADTGRLLGSFRSPHRPWAQALSHDGSALVVLGEGEKQNRCHLVETGKSFALPAVAFPSLVFVHPDAKSFFVVGRSVVDRHDLRSGKLLRTHDLPDDNSVGLAVSADRRWLAFTDRSAVYRLMDLTTGEIVPEPDGHRSAVDAVSFSPDGKSIVCRADGVYLWDAQTGRRRGRWRDHDSRHARTWFDARGLMMLEGARLLRMAVADGAVYLDEWDGDIPIAVTADGKRAASTSGRSEVEFWDVANRRRLARVALNEGELLEEDRAVFSRDGEKLLAVSRPGKEEPRLGNPRSLLVIDVRKAKVVARFSDAIGPRGHDGPPTWHPNGRDVVLCRDGTFLVLNPETKTATVLTEAKRGVEAFAISPDGRWLAYTSGDAVCLYEMAARGTAWTFAGRRGLVRSLAWSPDGRRLVSGGDDCTALVWDLFAIPFGRAGGDVEEAWRDLTSPDSGIAYGAMRHLAGRREGVADVLGPRLRKVLPPVGEERLAKLIEDLDAEDFDVRQTASAELANLGKDAEPALERARASNPGLEVVRRIDALLHAPKSSPEGRRTSRAVAVLEYARTPEAIALLRELARAAPHPTLREEASRALVRLTR